MSPNDLIAGGYRMSQQLLHRMADDLTADEFRHQPAPGANSAAWVIGHLAVTARRTAERLGATGLPPVTDALVARFTATRKPAEAQADLGEKAELLALFDACVEKVIAAVRALPAEALANSPAGPVPFATCQGEALLFGAIHLGMHTGQLSALRRSLGKPPVV